MGHAVGLLADGYTLGAVLGLTSFIGAFDLSYFQLLHSPASHT